MNITNIVSVLIYIVKYMYTPSCLGISIGGHEFPKAKMYSPDRKKSAWRWTKLKETVNIQLHVHIHARLYSNRMYGHLELQE